MSLTKKSGSAPGASRKILQRGRKVTKHCYLQHNSEALTLQRRNGSVVAIELNCNSTTSVVHDERVALCDERQFLYTTFGQRLNED